MPEVPYQKTDFGSPRGFTQQVHAALMRAGLADVPARLLTAHSVLSTNFGRGVHNFNLVGMKASSSWRATKPYAIAQGCECRPGLPDNGDPACSCKAGEGQFYKTVYWRAYNTLDDGAQALLAALQQSRYSRAYAMLLAGDTEYFAQVGRDGWYTADPASVKTGGETRLATINSWLGDPEGGSWLPLAVIVGLVWYALA